MPVKPIKQSAQIKSAMSKPDRAVPEPARNQAASFSTQVLNLAVGESVTRAVEININVSLSELPGQLRDAKESLRNSTTPCLRPARQATGGEYSIEVGDMRLSSGRTMVVAVVTRLT